MIKVKEMRVSTDFSVNAMTLFVGGPCRVRRFSWPILRKSFIGWKMQFPRRINHWDEYLQPSLL